MVHTTTAGPSAQDSAMIAPIPAAAAQDVNRHQADQRYRHEDDGDPAAENFALHRIPSRALTSR